MEADFRNLDPINGDSASMFDGVGAQAGEFDVVSCCGKLQLCWGRFGFAMQFRSFRFETRDLTRDCSHEQATKFLTTG